MENHYADITRTPFFLYGGVILFVGMLLSLIIVINYTQKENEQFVANPKVGDVYTIRKDEKNSTSYYFLRVSKIMGDTLFLYHSDLEYSGRVTKLNEEDFFVEDDEVVIIKSELKIMLDKVNIYSIERKYGNDEGFNRVKKARTE